LEFIVMRYPSRRDYARRTGGIATKIGRKSAEDQHGGEGIDA
jgi:hypothetical protein